VGNRYKSDKEVPKRWRKIEGTPLSLGQVESLLTAAEASPEPFAAALAAERRRFPENHHLASGQWVKN
jgi:hypothetical protein